MKNESGSGDEATYGLRFYQALRKLGLSSGLNYAEIQRLKAADRGEVASIFMGAGYAVVQAIKEGEPEAAALVLFTHRYAYAPQHGFSTAPFMFL